MNKQKFRESLAALCDKHGVDVFLFAGAVPSEGGFFNVCITGSIDKPLGAGIEESAVRALDSILTVVRESLK